MNIYLIILEMHTKDRCIGLISKKVDLPEAYTHASATKTKLNLSKDVGIEIPRRVDSVDAENQTEVLKSEDRIWVSSEFKQGIYG